MSRVRVLVAAIAFLGPLALAGCAHETGVPLDAGALPGGFSGGLIDTETVTPGLVDVASLSGYKTTFTFTKLVFQRDPQGLYTLNGGGLVSVESGNVIQKLSAPAGQSGTCLATFEFARAGGVAFDARLSGHIGGLVRTRSGYHATIELGVTLPGVITLSSDCGPNNESTSNLFGVPPKLSISISASAELDSKIGVLTVDPGADSSKTVTIGGGAEQTDVVTGELIAEGHP